MDSQQHAVRTKLDHTSQPAASDEAEIRGLINRWAKAVRDENREAIRADHDPDILMFDVPPPFLSRGLDEYMATWEKFFSSWTEKPAFDFHDCGGHCREGRGLCYGGRAVRRD